MRIFIVFLLVVTGIIWFEGYTFEHSVNVTIVWGKLGSITLTSTAILVASILIFVALTLVIIVLWFFFGLQSRVQRYFHRKDVDRASDELTRGLIHFTEGHWETAEKLLLNNVEYSKTPLLNYLAAARAAHTQEAFDRRDFYLKTASEYGTEAHVAVAALQAEMQFMGSQFEQARATLIHLLELSPKHPHATKLLAKVYYEQEDWSHLFELLPELNEQSLIKSSDQKTYEIKALTGIFYMLARKKEVSKLQLLWKKLPKNIREKSRSILLYCDALTEAGDKSSSDKLLTKMLSKNWDEGLIERYGVIEHDNLPVAIEQAREWLGNHKKSPMLLLVLARLTRKNKQWEESKKYYSDSLNLSPSAAVYLELAELLESLGGHQDDAEACYKQGLKYSIETRGEVLTLNPKNKIDKSTPPPF